MSRDESGHEGIYVECSTLIWKVMIDESQVWVSDHEIYWKLCYACMVRFSKHSPQANLNSLCHIYLSIFWEENNIIRWWYVLRKKWTKDYAYFLKNKNKK